MDLFHLCGFFTSGHLPLRAGGRPLQPHHPSFYRYPQHKMEETHPDFLFVAEGIHRIADGGFDSLVCDGSNSDLFDS